MALALTIQTADASDGTLRIEYSWSDGSGVQGIEWPVSDLSRFELSDAELKNFLCRFVLTWARRRGVTAAQMVGKTITFDPSLLANIVRVT